MFTENQHRGILQLIPGSTLPQKGDTVFGIEGIQLNALVFPIFSPAVDAFKLKRNITANKTSLDRSITVKALTGNRNITEKILFEKE